MGQRVLRSFEQVIPYGAEYCRAFFDAIGNQHAASQLGINFELVQPDYRSPRVVFLADLTVKSGRFLKGTPTKLEAYGDPIGSSLTVGWKLYEVAATGWTANTGMERDKQLFYSLRTAGLIKHGVTDL